MKSLTLLATCVILSSVAFALPASAQMSGQMEQGQAMAPSGMSSGRNMSQGSEMRKAKPMKVKKMKMKKKMSRKQMMMRDKGM
jgi:hypothetical protein